MEQKEKWTVRSHPRQFVVYLIVFVVVMALIGTGYGLAVKAWGAEVPSPARPDTLQRCVTYNGEPCPVVRPRDKRAARAWRAHKIRHADGFAPGKVFANLKVAKRIFVRKIERAIERRSASARETMFRRSECTQERCLAYQMYGQMVADAGCAGKVDAIYPFDRETCRYTDTTHQFTKTQIIGLGTVFFCGGGIVIGVAASPFTAGGTAFAAGFGATGCLFAGWAAMQ